MSMSIVESSNYSDYEEDDDLITIKKFLNTISEEIFSPFKEPLPDYEEFFRNPDSLENFFHQFFIRENYINMLIQITTQIIERHREKLNKKNNEISNLNHKVDSFKKELEYSKINLNEYKEMYNSLLTKYQKIEENLDMTESKNEILRWDLSKYENQVQSYIDIQEKYEELISFQSPCNEILEKTIDENKDLREYLNHYKSENQILQEELKNSKEKYLKLLESHEKINLSHSNLENRTKKLLNEISQLKENLVSLSEKNTELISELEISQSNKMKIHKVSFHSYEQLTEIENVKKNSVHDEIKQDSFSRPEHKRTGSLFNELISLRKVDINEEENEEGYNSRKESGVKKDELLSNLFFEPKLILECDSIKKNEEFFTEKKSESKRNPEIQARKSTSDNNFLTPSMRNETLKILGNIPKIHAFEINKELKKDQENKESPGLNKRDSYARYKRNPYFDFFILTSQCVKLNSNIMDDIIDIDPKPFYEEVINSAVPFHKWYQWMSNKFLEIKLEKKSRKNQ